MHHPLVITNVSFSSEISSFTQLIHPINKLVTVKLDDSNYLNNSIYGHKTIQPWALSNWHNSCSCSSHPWWIWWTLYDPEFVAYQRHDQLLTSWLLSSINPDLLPQFVGYESAHSIWKTISQLFAAQSARVMHLKLQCQTLKKGSSSMKEYLLKMKFICDTLAVCERPISDEIKFHHSCRS